MRYSHWSSGAFLLLGLYLLYQTADAPLGDFGNYYYASLFLLEGNFSPAIYEPYLFNELVNERVSEPVYLNYTPVPPTSAIFYLPFSWLPLSYSKLFFNLLGLLLFIWSFFRLVETLELARPWLLILLPFLFYTPFFNNFYQGQSYLYLLAAIMEGFRYWSKGWPITSGCLWAIPISLKIFPGIIILFLLFQNNRKALYSTVAFCLLFSFLPLLVIQPTSITTDYYLDLLPRLFDGEINDPFAILYQSSRVLINNALVYDDHLNPTAYSHQPTVATILQLLFQGVVFCWVISHLMQRPSSHFKTFAIVLFSALLLTGYGSSYSMMLLLPAALAFLPLTKCKWIPTMVMVLSFGFACNFPVYKLHDLHLALQFPRLYALLLLLLSFCFLPPVKVNRRVIALLGLLIIAKLLVELSRSSAVASYYLADASFGIIYHYESTKDSLLLEHFNQNGSQRTKVSIRDSIWQDNRLKIVGNQIYFDDKAITSSKSKKRLVRRLNETEILFLSDEKRGPGFYTLRKMPLPWDEQSTEK